MRTLSIFFLLVLLLAATGQAQTYFLNGDASYLGDDCYQLTPNLNTQNGTVWYADQIDLSQPFTIEFLMNLGSNDANGADGMVFVLQQEGTSAIGESGGGMGYLGFNGTIGVEFDTWQNLDYNDPVQDHIAVVSNGDINHASGNTLAGPVFMNNLGTNQENGQDHIVKVQWLPEFTTLRVFWDCTLRINAQIDIINDIFNGDPVVYWGFTGATGGASNLQTVCLEENILSIGPDVTICNGSSTELNVAGDPENEYSWFPPEGLDDPTSQTPVASPSETTEYIVSYVDLCDDIVSDTVTVTVQDLVVTIDTTAELSCDEPEIFLSSAINFNNTVSYSWQTPNGNIVLGSSSSTPLIDEPGTYIVEASFVGICTDTDTLEVVGNWDFDVDVPVNGIITCDQDQIVLTANNDAAGDVNYNWSTNGGSIASGIFGQSINAAAGGDYTVIASINAFCADTVTVSVEADNAPPALSIDPVGQIDCINATQTLDANTDSAPFEATWSTDIGNFVSGEDGLTPVVDAGGIYTLTLENPNNGCLSEASVTVNENFATPTVDAGVTDTLTCRDPLVVFNPIITGENTSVQWSTDLGNIVEGSNAVNATADAEGTYVITVTNTASGCTDSDDVDVVVTEDFFLDLTTLTLPNIFTPNGDLLNAQYGPYLLEDPEFNLVEVMAVYELQIFNRWGNLVFTSDTENAPRWNGQTGSSDAKNGAYYAVFTYEVDCGTEQTGTVDTHLHVIR